METIEKLIKARDNAIREALVDHARKLVDELDERDMRDRLDDDEIRIERMIDDNGQLYWHNEPCKKNPGLSNARQCSSPGSITSRTLEVGLVR